jgi:hypothetical protein
MPLPLLLILLCSRNCWHLCLVAPTLLVPLRLLFFAAFTQHDCRSVLSLLSPLHLLFSVPLFGAVTACTAALATVDAASTSVAP